MRSAFDDAVRVLASQRGEIVELEDPVDFEQILKDHRTRDGRRGRGVHSDWLDEFPDDYPPRIRELIVEGRSLDGARSTLQAKERMDPARRCSRSWTRSAARRSVDALITPATISTAPDPSTTGDPAFNSPWSYTGLPTVSFPIGLAPDGLPVAIQLVGRFQRDCELLRDRPVVRTSDPNLAAVKGSSHGRSRAQRIARPTGKRTSTKTTRRSSAPRKASKPPWRASS